MKLTVLLAAALSLIHTTSLSAQTLEFPKLRDEMNRKYKQYFAHHKLSLVGTKDEGKSKIFYVTFPDPDMQVLITARCDGLNEGGWMCMLAPNYGNIGVLPLVVK